MNLGRWVHLGHRLGECWRDDTNDITYVHVPKNASSFIKGCLIGCYGMWRHSESLTNGKENLIVLRDPIERWCSGIAQFIYNNPTLNLTEQEIFDQITFDDHTDLQTYFLQGVDLTCATFMLADTKLRDTFTKWVKEHGYRTNISIVEHYNASSSDGRAPIKNRYIKLLSKHPEYVVKLKEYFADDYKLIESVKFYD